MRETLLTLPSPSVYWTSGQREAPTGEKTMATKTDRKACNRCKGTGEIKIYAHVVAGVCFRCDGAGVEPTAAERAAAKLSQARKALEIAIADQSYRAAGLERAIAAADVVVVDVLSTHPVDVQLREAWIARHGAEAFAAAEAERRQRDNANKEAAVNKARALHAATFAVVAEREADLRKLEAASGK